MDTWGPPVTFTQAGKRTVRVTVETHLHDDSVHRYTDENGSEVLRTIEYRDEQGRRCTTWEYVPE